MNPLDGAMHVGVDAVSLAQTPLPRRLAVRRGSERQVYIDARRTAADAEVDLTLLVETPPPPGARPAGRLDAIGQADPQAAPVLSHRAAFDLFMPEHAPPADATLELVAHAWFRGCRDMAPGAASLLLARDLLPVEAVAARRVLHSAATRASALQGAAGIDTVRPQTCSGPLHEVGWQQRDAHELLDACLAFLRRDPQTGIEERSGQTRMAHAVLDVLCRDGSLVVEAGTGTGKTLAYALPAVLVAALHDKRIILSTHTRNLQQQLAARDLPWLWAQLGLDGVARGTERSGLRFARLLGRTNYVCRHALQAWIERQRNTAGGFLAAQVVLALLRSPDGTLEDVLPDLPGAVWSEIHSRRGACVGRRCRGDNPCPVYRVRDAARRADVLVVNHALLLADARGGGGIFGPWHGLVNDEAHHLQAVATEALGHRLGPAPIEALSRPLADLEREAHAIRDLADGARWGQRALAWCDVQRALQKRLFAWWRDLDAALPQRGRVPPRQRYQDGAEVFGCLGEETREMQLELNRCWRNGLQDITSLEDRVADMPEFSELLELYSVSVDLLVEVAAAFEFLVRGEDEDWAFFVDFSSADSTLHEIVALPLDVAQTLPELLRFGDAGAVFTSATLCVDDDSSWFRKQIGVDALAATLQVESPFDHASQCLLAQTANLGDWRDPDFVPQVSELVAALQQGTQRRTLVLLTSRRMVAEMQAVLRDLLPRDVTLLSQTESSSRSRLAARFAATPGAILLGLASFWEGVDFPGRALELLVIPKLPFLVPNEPLVEARCQRLRARGEDAFGDFLLPEAILRLRQGFGRLLRTPHDRGAVVLLDARLETRAYGAEFLRPLPLPSRVFEDADSLVRAVIDWCGAASRVSSGPRVVTGEAVDFLPEQT